MTNKQKEIADDHIMLFWEDAITHVLQYGLAELNEIQQAVYHTKYAEMYGGYMPQWVREHSHIPTKELIKSLDLSFNLIAEPERMQFYNESIELYTKVGIEGLEDEDSPEILEINQIFRRYSAYIDKNDRQKFLEFAFEHKDKLPGLR